MRKRDELVRSLGRHHRRHVRDGQHIAFGDRIGLDLAQRLGGHAYFPAGNRLTQGGGLVGHIHHLDAAVGVDVGEVRKSRCRVVARSRRDRIILLPGPLVNPFFGLAPCSHSASGASLWRLTTRLRDDAPTSAGAPRPLYLPPAWYSPGWSPGHPPGPSR